MFTTEPPGPDALEWELSIVEQIISNCYLCLALTSMYCYQSCHHRYALMYCHIPTTEYSIECPIID